MAFFRDPVRTVRPRPFEPQPLHIPAANPGERGLIERGEAPEEEHDPGGGTPGTHVFEIDIS